MRKALRDLFMGQSPELLENLSIPAVVRDGAACGSVTGDLFFSENLAEINEARSICAQCPVQSACLDWGTWNEEYGVWGGMTPRERKKLRAGKSLISLEDRYEVAQLRADVLGLKSAEEIAEKHGVDVRTVYRWQLLLKDNNVA